MLHSLVRTCTQPLELSFSMVSTLAAVNPLINLCLEMAELQILIFWMALALVPDYTEGLSSSIVKALSILDRSLLEDDFLKCDLVILGGHWDLKDEELNGRAIIRSSQANAYAMAKNLLIHSSCIILLSKDSQKYNELAELGMKFQSIRPVGLILDETDWHQDADKLFTIDPFFPMIIKNNGMIVQGGEK